MLVACATRFDVIVPIYLEISRQKTLAWWQTKPLALLTLADSDLHHSRFFSGAPLHVLSNADKRAGVCQIPAKSRII